MLETIYEQLINLYHAELIGDNIWCIPEKKIFIKVDKEISTILLTSDFKVLYNWL